MSEPTRSASPASPSTAATMNSASPPPQLTKVTVGGAFRVGPHAWRFHRRSPDAQACACRDEARAYGESEKPACPPPAFADLARGGAGVSGHVSGQVLTFLSGERHLPSRAARTLSLVCPPGNLPSLLAFAAGRLKRGEYVHVAGGG